MNFKRLCFIACVSILSLGALRPFNKKMQEAAAVLGDLTQDIYSPTDEGGKMRAQQRILAETKKLRQFVHAINPAKNAKVPDADPTLGLVSNLFERELARAEGAIQQGHVAYAKRLLQTATAYCITCHSRDNSGPQFPSTGLDAKLKNLKRPERAQILASLRQFDAALAEYAQLAEDGDFAKSHPVQWQRSLRTGLALAIRVKADPSEALKIVNRANAMTRRVPELPGYLKQHLKSWKTALETWNGQKPTPGAPEPQQFEETKRRFEEARSKQRYPADHSADPDFLRATAAAHTYMREYPSGAHVADVLEIAGASYEVLDDSMTSPLHELYYEMCIRRSPHSPTAARCFDRLEEAVVFGYTGSAGYALPKEVKKTLAELRQLAEPKTAGTSLGQQ